MVTCDSCGKEIERAAFCSAKCKVRAHRRKPKLLAGNKIENYTTPAKNLSKDHFARKAK